MIGNEVDVADLPRIAPPPGGTIRRHFRDLARELEVAERHASHLEAWGRELAARLTRGSRLLVAGNGGSAAEAQHFAAELVGRYREERPAFSAIALTAESSSLTAIGNDYGFAEVYARQVRAHARSGDLLILISTSGASRNLVEAARAAEHLGVTSWAVTGPGPNPLSTLCTDAVCFDGPSPHVQECQLAAIHAICEVFDEHCRAGSTRGRRP